MSLTITDVTITSDVTEVWAGLCLPPEEGWRVSSYGGRRFDRNQAITAMTIAEERVKPEPDQALIASLESEL